MENEELEQEIRRAFYECRERPLNYPGSTDFELFRLGFLAGRRNEVTIRVIVE